MRNRDRLDRELRDRWASRIERRADPLSDVLRLRIGPGDLERLRVLAKRHSASVSAVVRALIHLVDAPPKG